MESGRVLYRWMPGCWNRVGYEMLCREGLDASPQHELPPYSDLQAKRTRQEARRRCRKRRLIPWSMCNMSESQEDLMLWQLRPSTTGHGWRHDRELMLRRGGFYNLPPPGLPSIDEHVDNDGIKWRSLVSSLQCDRNANLTSRPSVTRTVARKKDDGKVGRFTNEDIQVVVQYIDSLGDSDGTVSFEELDLAFRRARKIRAAQSFENEGRNCMARLEQIFKACNLNIVRFFYKLDKNRGGKGDRKLSLGELRAGLQQLTEPPEMAQLRFSEDELITLLRYMDPNADGELELREIEEAFKRAHTPVPELEKHAAVGKILHMLDVAMERRKTRLMDLFRELDSDNSGSVTLDELRVCLKRLFRRN